MVFEEADGSSHGSSRREGTVWGRFEEGPSGPKANSGAQCSFKHCVSSSGSKCGPEQAAASLGLELVSQC